MQHAVDLHRSHRGALERRQQDAAQRIAQRHAEAALERLGDQRRDPLAILPSLHLELGAADEFLPILLIDLHVFIPWSSGAINVRTPTLCSTCRRPCTAADYDPAALGRPAAIVRNGRHVADRRDLQPAGLQRTQRRFTARARPRNLDLDGPHAVLHGGSAGLFGRHLGGIGVDLRDPLKPSLPAEAQAMVLPWTSVMVIIVLLKDALTCTTPEVMFLRSLRRGRTGSLAIWLFSPVM